MKTYRYLIVSMLVAPGMVLAQQPPGRPGGDRPRDGGARPDRPAEHPVPGRPQPGNGARPMPEHGNRPAPGRPERPTPTPGRPQPGRPQPGRPEPGRPEAGRPTSQEGPNQAGPVAPAAATTVPAKAVRRASGRSVARRSTIRAAMGIAAGRSGMLLPSLFLGSAYVIHNYWDLGVEAPPPGYYWVRYGPDLLLVQRGTRRIADVIYGAFY